MDSRGPRRDRVLGRGRSGAVYLRADAGGRLTAGKVFDSHAVTKAVQVAFLGSPNPYIWNRAAVRCAYLRRRILSALAPYWFGERLRVASASGFTWNADESAFELLTEFSPGRNAALYNPLRPGAEDEAAELWHAIMIPLQERLIAAGLDGMVWQAGKGNPVALNNFLAEDLPGGGRRWVWIDLESGVPALAALNPLALFGFYLPRSFAYRRPLFDDFNGPRLRAYLEAEREGLERRLGPAGFAELMGWAGEMETEQREWKSLRRVARSVGYRHARGAITGEQAAYYRTRPLRWYSREALRLAQKALRRLARLPAALWSWVARIPVRTILAGTGRFLVSQRFRARLARLYLAGRLIDWRRRRQMSRAEARHLRGQMVEEETGSYITDFGVHLAIKPFVKTVEWGVFPALAGAGIVSEATLAVAVILGGCIARTAYTLGRFIQAALRRREKPWVALVVGTLPVVGNFAYPLQILYSSTDEQDDLARFIVYDGFARLGRAVPIWGGQDTMTEHWFNRLPRRMAFLAPARAAKVLPEAAEEPADTRP